ncbi:MAG: biotin--[acetyl-CoA-carboxylase] ligase [Porphyrobacter sp.]|nr:biotin--[acetyl-CoA-carboxylase] ligase [Porphyrobacter sp.]
MIRVVPETGSTNADLLARIAAGEHLAEGDWLVADRQTGGRGRQGRSWLDAPGNFMGSTVVHVSPQDPPAASLSFVAALAVYETVLARLGNPRELQLKWPNDVLLGGEKFCGLLLEREAETVVVGIGVNLAAAPAVADRRARTLAEFGPAPDRDAFAADLAAQLDLELGRWRQYGLEPILNRWLAAAHPVGSALTVHEPSGTRLSGTFAGLERDGALRLRLADGSARVIHAGDVMLGGVA